jgi:hypothetical protein
MEETLQIRKKSQRSTQDVSHRKTFPFGLRPPSDVYARQAAKSIQIQSGRQQPFGDLKVETRARRDPLDVSCIYHKGTQYTLRGCRLRKKIDQEHDVSRAVRAPTSPDDSEFQKARIRISPNDQRSTRRRVLVVSANDHHGSARQIPRRRVGSRPTRTALRGGRRTAPSSTPMCP